MGLSLELVDWYTGFPKKQAARYMVNFLFNLDPNLISASLSLRLVSCL